MITDYFHDTGIKLFILVQFRVGLIESPYLLKTIKYRLIIIITIIIYHFTGLEKDTFVDVV
jgi:hypothetical protein